jgi:hypothetical protein
MRDTRRRGQADTCPRVSKRTLKRVHARAHTILRDRRIQDYLEAV